MGNSIDNPTRLLSVPDLAEAMGMRLDKFRKVISRRPELAALLTPVGPMKVLDSSRLEEFRNLLTAS